MNLMRRDINKRISNETEECSERLHCTGFFHECGMCVYKTRVALSVRSGTQGARPGRR